MTDPVAIIADLADEHAALDERVRDLDERQWQAPSPAAGWTIRDSISHLYYFDARALFAITDPDGFARHRAEVHASGLAPGIDVAPGRELGGRGLLRAWRETRADLLAGLAAFDPGRRALWYGPDMSLTSFVTARLMETWAHGQDVADALDLPPVVTDRLRSVCHIGIGARAYSFWQNAVTDPGDPIRVEVTGPSGQLWTWGPRDAADRVTGTALDLALLVTHRRHRSDTSLTVTGETAEAWLAIAQAFAGPSGGGRQPLSAKVA
nr:TIGR03084 family metal-binding protein [Dactylosporangium thailandense]